MVKPDWGIRGGFELVLDRLVVHLRSQGHRVDTLRVNAWTKGERLHRRTVPAELHARAPQLFDYLALFELCRRLDARVADVVLSTQPPSFAIEHPRHLSLFYHHNRIFYDLADTAVAAGLVAADVHGAAVDAVRQVDGPAISNVAFVLAGSETVASRLVEFDGRCDGVGLFHAGPTIDPFPRETCEPERDTALCVSRHTFPKRTELFVHAMHLVPGVRGLAIGGGGRLGFARQLDLRLSEQGAPEHLCPAETWLNTPRWIDPDELPSGVSNVTFRESVDSDGLRSAFESALCLVAPALDEDYGLTAIEAMQHGVPIVTCTDSGHLTYFVEHGVTGLVVEPTAAAIAGAVRELADDRQRATTMGAAGQARAAEYTWARAFAEFDEGLGAVLS